MRNRRQASTVMATLVILGGMTSNCGGRSPSAPSQSATAPTAAPVIVSVFPSLGTTAGGTAVTIIGSGFETGATVTLDGVAMNANVVFGTRINGTTPAHDVGTVDVVVTNPDGRSGSLRGGYTYVPPVSVAAVSPEIGSTGGGTLVTLTGTSFQPGATVTFDGARASAYVPNSTTIYATTPAGRAGAVDVVVTNPGGEIGRLAGGYTYAPPESFDFNGAWAGLAGAEYDAEIRFTIERGALASVACGTAEIFSFSPPIPVTSEFSFVRDDGIGISGRIVSASSAVGTINIPPCSATIWIAAKQ